jgi:hypothetical protein
VYKRLYKQIPSQEDKNIDGILKQVTGASQNLKSCTEDIVSKKIAETHQSTTENLRETKAIRQTSNSTHVRVGNISKDLKVIGENVQSQHEEIKAQFEQVEEKVQTKGEEVKIQMAQVEENIDAKGAEVKVEIAQVGKSIEVLGDKVAQLKEEIREARNATTQNINPKFAAEIQTGIYYIVVERIYIQGQPNITILEKNPLTAEIYPRQPTSSSIPTSNTTTQPKSIFLFAGAVKYLESAASDSNTRP